MKGGGKREKTDKEGEMGKERKGKGVISFYFDQILTPSLTKSVPLDKFWKLRLSIMKSYK